MSPRSACVFAWCALVVVIPQSSHGQGADPAALATAERTYRLTGVVTDADREPIPEAQVVLMELGSPGLAASTDARGRFDLGQFAPATRSLRVRRLGYEQRTLQVQIGAGGQHTAVEIALRTVPSELEDVYISSAPQGRLREFYQRRQQRGTFGRFLEQDDIRRLGSTNASDLFRSVPGITIAANAMGGNAIRIRNCQPMVYVDGQRNPGAELDEVILPGDIAAIEFYPSSAGIPAQYLERGNRLCGLILVWTKVR